MSGWLTSFHPMTWLSPTKQERLQWHQEQKLEGEQLLLLLLLSLLLFVVALLVALLCAAIDGSHGGIG